MTGSVNIPYANTSRKPRALDLFCGAGGAAMGLIRAGFEVWGIDNKHHPYPGHFILGDALRPPVRLADFDFVWASPPCQRYSPATRQFDQSRYPDLVATVQLMLRGYPYCIENVLQSPHRHDLILHGGMFGLPIWRRRAFELGGFMVLAPGAALPKKSWSIVSHRGGLSPKFRMTWRIPKTIAEKQRIMGIDWTDNDKEICEAVPVCYAEFIGGEFLKQWRGRT
jgi:DNA (cytosine-5)-methyltransferase 1